MTASSSSGVSSGFAGSVGNTPLIRLRALSEETGCEILGKAEFMNPGGSVKDRAARGIIEAAEEHGELKPGGTVGTLCTSAPSISSSLYFSGDWLSGITMTSR